ncbi:MAG TPA: S8 family serine peptidase, partial [Candidatus Kapabacteria bacterium]
MNRCSLTSVTISMYRRTLFFFLFAAMFAVTAVAQQPVVPASDLVIVKFRTTSAMNDAKIAAVLNGIRQTGTELTTVFHRPSSKNSILSVDTIGLDRIVQVPLRDGVSPQQAMQALSGLAGIEYVEPNYIYRLQTGEHIPNDPLFPSQWWLDAIDAPKAWSMTEGDSSILIGYVDEGVNWLHPDLIDQFAVNSAEDLNHNGLFDAWPSDSIGMDAHGQMVSGDLDGNDHDGDGFPNDVIGWDFVDNGPIPYDVPGGGHGTAMAGLMAAKQDNHVGISGVAPKCKLLVLKAFDQTGTGADVNIAPAIVYAADHRVKVLNLSFGDIIPSLLQRDAIRYAISKGVTVFASSGDNGGTGPNYPSDFDEVISVGSPPRSGYANPSTYGVELDVVAPGIQVLTTTQSGGYDSVTGTSASSAIATGIGALLLSKNPSLTPLQVRSILLTTTDSLPDRAVNANGELDAYQALTYPGIAQIKMVTPHSLDQFHIGDTIRVTGYAMSTLFTGYTLSWSKNYKKDSLGFDAVGDYGIIQYDSLAGGTFDSSNAQVLNGTLGTLSTTGFDTGTYILTLSVQSSDRRTTEERVAIDMTRSKPKFIAFHVDSIWINAERGLLLQATTDLPAQFQITYSDANSKPAFIADDKIGFEHAILLPREQAVGGVPISIIAQLVTPSGDTTAIDTTAIIPNDAVAEYPQGGFLQKPYTLPPGFVLDSVLSVPTGDEVVENPSSTDNLTIFKFDSSELQFVPGDSAEDTRLPQAIGNSQGIGGPELLVQTQGEPGMAIYKQNASHSILGSLIYQNNSIQGSTFGTFDAGSMQSIVGVLDSAWVSYRYDAGTYSLLGSGVNRSTPDYYNYNNHITWANVKAADFLGTGTQQLVVLDDDADLMMYERDASAPNGFRAVYLDSNDGASAGTLLTVGDFDGDGKPDIAFAYHPIEEQDTLDDYHAAYWTLIVLRNLGNLQFDTMYIDRFYGDNENDHFFLGGPQGTIGRLTNVTGKSVDDLAVSFFPNFYLLEYDSTIHSMRPIWNYPISVYKTMSWDFDRNGKREFGFLAGDSIRFFEHSDRYTEQTPAPSGLIVTPRDSDRVDLEWAPVPNATEYYVLRAAPENINRGYALIDSTIVPNYIDTNVGNGDTLIYSVAAVAPTYAIPQSLPAYGQEMIVHPMPTLMSAMVSSNNIRVKTSQPPSTARIFAGTIMIDDTLGPDAITSTLDSEIVMELSKPMTAGSHRMRVTSFDLRDDLNSPFDTVHYLSFQVPIDTALPRFYIVRWTFENSMTGLEIHVFFNAEPGTDALDISHYSLSPFGTLNTARRDTANPDALYIELSGVSLTALGVPFVLCVSNIESATNVPLDATNGNCVGVSLTEPDLSNVMVYPNPAKQSL